MVCPAASLFHFELCSHQHRYVELLRELEGLVHGIYAHIPPAIQDELARDHFLEALFPANLRVQTLLAQPKYLHDALELAIEGNAHWRTHLTSPRRVERQTGLS